MGRARIFQINISAGGVPKLPVSEAEVTSLGLKGDKQRAKNHGGSERAVCLYALEVIEELRREGHPIYPGSTGENITTANLDWATISPGAKLKIGAEVVLEMTKFPSPCKTIADSFVDGDFKRVSNKKQPGYSRICARVINPGVIRVGDRVEILEG